MPVRWKWLVLWENITALLISVNRRYRVHHSGIRITGLPAESNPVGHGLQAVPWAGLKTGPTVHPINRDGEDASESRLSIDTGRDGV